MFLYRKKQIATQTYFHRSMLLSVFCFFTFLLFFKLLVCVCVCVCVCTATRLTASTFICFSPLLILLFYIILSLLPYSFRHIVTCILEIFFLTVSTVSSFISISVLSPFLVCLCLLIYYILSFFI